MATSLDDKYEPIDRYRAVAEHGDGLLVVSAGPGTGKTFSLLRRIESLLDFGVDPRQICYLTFVNSIVEAFKDDARKPKQEGGLGADPEALGIHISTLHSLAFKIVSVYSGELRLPSHMEVIDLSPKPQSLLSQVFVSDLFEYAKNKGIITNKKSFDQVLRKLTEVWRHNTDPGAQCNQLGEVIELHCGRYSVCPWDQLVLLAIKALTENGLPTWLKEVRHFLIDEYQDFNPAEQQLLELITEPSDSVIIVGDPNQSIYSGRSASPQGLANLLMSDKAEYVNFVFCRRCSKKVLKAANSLLKFMDETRYSERELQLFKEEDGEFVVSQFKSCKAEVRYIASILIPLEPSDKDDSTILLPSRKACQYYAKQLRGAGVDCCVNTTDASLELLTAILCLVILHNQRFLERVVLSCFADLDRKYRNQVLPIFLNGDGSLIETLRQASTDHKWQKRLRDSLSSFTATIEKLISDDSALIMAGLSDLNFKVSKDVIDSLLSSDTGLPARQRVDLALDLVSQETVEVTGASTPIQVMTMHSSKGLSKQIVIIPAFDEKLLPGDHKEERLAEMHRLLYVAVTRAESQVLITFPKTRAKGDPLNFGDRPKISSYAKILIPPQNR